MGKYKSSKLSSNNRSTPVGYMGSPLHFDWDNLLDKTQTGIMGLGMIPGVGIVADLANTAISGGRAAYNYAKGDTEAAKKHTINMGVNAAAMIPVAGQGVAAGKIAHGVGKEAFKEVVKGGTKEIAKHTVKKGTKNVVKTGAKDVLKSVDELADKKNNAKGVSTTKKNVAENRSNTKPDNVA